MSFPPERITVKRRRDDDPVEALFIQPKKHRPNGFWTLVNDDNNTPQYAVPIASANAFNEVRITVTAFNQPKIPTVRTTSPSEDNNGQENAIDRIPENKNPRIHTPPTNEKRQLPSENTQFKRPRQHTHNIFASALKARKFHLVRSPSPVSSPFLAPKTVAQKHRNRRKKELAVFVERPGFVDEKKSGNVSRLSDGEPGHVVDDKGSDALQLDRIRKRPNATAAERKWRTETWANPPKPNEANGKLTKTAETINEPSSQWNYESIQLAEQLQAVALEEIRASEESAKGFNGSGLKVKPKPPKPRQSRTDNQAVRDDENEIVRGNINLDNDGDYVLDTYVRSNAQPFEVSEPVDLHHNSSHAMHNGNIGILVIEDEEEEALWDAFAEDQESDPEWNSEEEDENAEDYYGNDYPEEEVDGEDEFDRGAYNYRTAASSDEEFGYEN